MKEMEGKRKVDEAALKAAMEQNVSGDGSHVTKSEVRSEMRMMSSNRDDGCGQPDCCVGNPGC